ncbi:MAG: flagellar filament capping protein FliD [Thermodesulfobacteriota bacterium]
MAGSISILGVGSGLQLQNILDQLKQAERVPILRKEASKLAIQDRMSELDTVQGMLLALKDQALTLSLSSTYLGRSVSLSDHGPLSVTADSGAATGSHHLNVVRLAATSAWRSSQGFASPSSSVNGTGSAETFSYSLGGRSTSVSVASGASLQSLAALINDDPGNPGVTASVITDGSGGTPYKLLLQSGTMGESGRVTVTQQLTDITMDQITGQVAGELDSSIEVDGVAFTRGSNSFSDVLNGFSFQLQATGETTMTVEADTSEIGYRVRSFVTGWNDLVGEIKANSGYDTETGVAGSLHGVTSLSTLQSQLMAVATGTVETGGDITSLFDLGLTFERDGTITLDDETLDAAIADHAQEVQDLLLGTDEVTGWADQVNTVLRGATRASGGLVPEEKATAQARIDLMDEQITQAESRLEKRFEILTRQFLELDRYMSTMQSTSTYLSQQFDAINNLFSNQNR